MKVEHQIAIGTMFGFPITEIDEAIIFLSAMIDFYRAMKVDTSEAEVVLRKMQEEFNLHHLH